MRLRKLRRSLLAAAFVCSGAALHAADTFEPNDTRETATPIASGSPLCRRIRRPDDVDFYHFSLSSAQHVRIDLAVPDAANYAVALHQEFSAVRDPIEMYVSDNPGTAVDERLEWTLAPGNYWIVVRVGSPSPAYDPDASYTLTLTAPLTGGHVRAEQHACRRHLAAARDDDPIGQVHAQRRRLVPYRVHGRSAPVDRTRRAGRSGLQPEFVQRRGFAGRRRRHRGLSARH